LQVWKIRSWASCGGWVREMGGIILTTKSIFKEKKFENMSKELKSIKMRRSFGKESNRNKTL